MKKIKSFFSICIALVMCFAMATTAFAATPAEAVIDTSKTGSVTIVKYDRTESEKANALSASYVATGTASSAAEEALAAYAIEGVEFTLLKVASITTYSNSGNVQVLYGFDKTTSAALLKAIGLENGKDRFAAADSLDNTKYYYQSNVLNKALSNSLIANEIATTNAFESYVTNNSEKIIMPLTSKTGSTHAEGLALGLYIAVETKVPENVVDTTNPFFVSIPMTTVDGKNWNYDVTVYPKNDTGNPTLDKAVREAISSTGKTETFTDYATASAGDIVEYEIKSTLPTITSNATKLTKYDFIDTLSEGISYDKTYAMTYEIYEDAALSKKVATLAADEYAVTYKANTMTITLTEKGIAKVNGYSEHTIRIVYGCKLNSNETIIIGESGNSNDVVLTWERTSNGYYDTLEADAIVYSFGVDITKEFSDKLPEEAKAEGLLDKVSFAIYNESENAYVQGELKAGVYYVTGLADTAMSFVPQNNGNVIIVGLEDDAYRITETTTADGYSLLKENINVNITFDKTAAASVDGNAVEMTASGVSENAIVELSVINTKIFELPGTGDSGFMYIVLIGFVIMAGAAIAIFRAAAKDESNK